MSFWDTRQAAAVLKHEVLLRYVVVFASKTGSQSRGRVNFFDGYAGPGQYDDVSPGSPLLALQAARQVEAFRTLRCIFVEKDPELYARLQALVDEEAEGLAVEARLGPVEDHIAQVIEGCGREPLFAFLDPFGVGIPFDTLTKLVLARSARGAKTEVLLNFTVQGLNRIGGLITSGASNRDAALRRMNDTLGGDWWQEVYRNIGKDDRLSAIVAWYRSRISEATSGFGGWTIPVSDRIGANPEYLLIHFTQHPDGVWEFHEALSFATAAWRKAARAAHPDPAAAAAAAGQITLDGMDEPVAFEEDEQAWVDEIYWRVRTLVDAGTTVQVNRAMGRVFGKALGIARERHLRKALKRLKSEGRLRDDPKGKLQNYVIAPATPVAP